MYILNNAIYTHKLVKIMGMLDPQASLQQFALMSHEAILDQIKLVPN